MSLPWINFEIAYVTIELESAFLVAAGDNDNLYDSVFVTDANGLPCIPGESLAGVLRHALAGDDCPEENPKCREVFGYQASGEGRASRIRVSYGHVHTQRDKPVAFRGADISTDPVLAALCAGVGRDHVRIGKYGAAEAAGKFDERLIPAGARFTFEICLSDEAGIKLDEIVNLLRSPGVRIGGKTRRGMGKFKVVRALSARFDLSKKEDLKKLGELPVALEAAVSSKVLKPLNLPKAQELSSHLSGTIKLKPLGTWMVGGGEPTGKEPVRHRKGGDAGEWDRLPLSEVRIDWPSGMGKVAEGKSAPYLLPASSVKGAVRHRTGFHARRLKGDWYTGDPANHTGFDESEVALFGDVRSGKDGKPGIVYFSDVYLAPETQLQVLQHVSLDRFTQGPMDHMLYDELALIGGELSIEVTIDAGLLKDDIAREALDAALCDLVEGRLALGAGRGHGRFKGEITWHGNKSLVAKEMELC